MLVALCAPDHEEDAVTVRSCSLLAAAVGLWLANPLPRLVAGQESAGQIAPPARLAVAPDQALTTPAGSSANQQLADTIAATLQQSEQLRHYQVDVVVVGGSVAVSGQVANPAQRAEVLRIVQGVPGVAGVTDRLVVREAASVTRTNALLQPALQEPAPLPGKGIGNAPPPPPPGAPAPEPTPIFQAQPGASYAALNPPPLPPYAWPTYAPYNNYSRVAYPTVYPYQAWPYIGPQYPFPKVPLGWRSVSLEYYNGHWWYGKRANGHDWWRLRFW